MRYDEPRLVWTRLTTTLRDWTNKYIFDRNAGVVPSLSR
jgi:hypothetical protein